MHPIEHIKLALDHRKAVIDKALVGGEQWRGKITREDGVVVRIVITPPPPAITNDDETEFLMGTHSVEVSADL